MLKASLINPKFLLYILKLGNINPQSIFRLQQPNCKGLCSKIILQYSYFSNTFSYEAVKQTMKSSCTSPVVENMLDISRHASPLVYTPYRKRESFFMNSIHQQASESTKRWSHLAHLMAPSRTRTLARS